MANITYSVDSTTLILNGYIFNNLVTGDVIVLAPKNPATSRVDAANGVSISKRADADVHTLTVRVQKDSDDDAFLNSIRNNATLEEIQGSLKESFVKNGIAGIDGVTLSGGSITAQPTITKNNTDGNAMMEYQVEFRSAVRVL